MLGLGAGVTWVYVAVGCTRHDCHCKHIPLLPQLLQHCIVCYCLQTLDDHCQMSHMTLHAAQPLSSIVTCACHHWLLHEFQHLYTCLCAHVGASQTEQLYDEEGQYNPHLAKAVKKRAKKQKQQPMDEDAFDFGEAFADEPDAAEAVTDSDVDGTAGLDQQADDDAIDDDADAADREQEDSESD